MTETMVILRRTKKIKTWLPAGTPLPAHSDTALGDWYATRLIVDRQPLVLLVSSTSLLPLITPARALRTLPSRLGALVEARLRRLGVDSQAIEAERAAMGSVVVGPTIDRSVVGIMVDFAKGVPYYFKAGRWRETDLPGAEDWLAKTPCHASMRGDRAIFPDQKAPELLHAKWLLQGAGPHRAERFRVM